MIGDKDIFITIENRSNPHKTDSFAFPLASLCHPIHKL
jgi:hypothetical protein